MFKSLIILAFALSLLLSCSNQDRKNNVPEYLVNIISYFDSNRLKEFDTISYTKDANWHNHLWKIGDTEVEIYSYRIGFEHHANQDYTFPEKDCLERISIGSIKKFAFDFPLNISLPDKNLEMILNKQGLVTCEVDYMNHDYNEKTKIIFKDLNPDSIFSVRNPFAYFKSRSNKMDSLGISEVERHSWGNFITIALKNNDEYLDYLPDNLSIDPKYKYKKVFDSVIAKGFKIDKNWVWRTNTKLPPH
jgi:hypothetical protein